jgi:hypothetical protein
MADTGFRLLAHRVVALLTKRCEFAAQVMCADAGFHVDQAGRYVGEPRFHLATRPLLPQHDGAGRIVAHDVKPVLADIDANHGRWVFWIWRAPCLWRPLPVSIAGGARARRDHPISEP